MVLLGSLYALPLTWLEGATVQGEQSTDLSPPPQQHLQQLASTSTSAWSEAGATCLACGIGINSSGFITAAEQRAHFKTDWHRYNVKQRLLKRQGVTEEEFEKLLGDSDSEVSSISGSSSESSEDSEDEQAHHPNGPRRRRGAADQGGVPPQATFTSQGGQQFCVWKCLLARDHVRSHVEPPTPTQLLEELQRLRASTGTFLIVLVRGGHFAAAVFRARPLKASKHDSKAGLTGPEAGIGIGGSEGVPNTSQAPARAKPDAAAPKANELFEVVAHKTFHRYVVRAKAGGRQSAKDGTGKFAKSAGAALRRYNEAALDKEIAELLGTWRQHLDAADLIFVQAPSGNARSVFESAELDSSSGATSLSAAGAGSAARLLSPQDPRVRRIPFVTQRPTFTEARRVVGLLLAVFEPSAAALAAKQAAAEAEEAAVEQRSVRRQLRATQRAAKLTGRSQGGQEASTTGAREEEERAEAARQAVPIQETPLHTASAAGDHKEVGQLLDAGADPCARDSRGRTPYAVAGSKEVRDAYRRFRAAQPDVWDYTAAGVPAALSEELESAQAAKRTEKRLRQRERDRGRKAEGDGVREAVARAAAAEEVARAATEATLLSAKLHAAQETKGSMGGKKVRGQGTQAQTQQPKPLSAEEQAKRREMAAAAAEARMRAMQLASTQQQLY